MSYCAGVYPAPKATEGERLVATVALEEMTIEVIGHILTGPYWASSADNTTSKTGPLAQDRVVFQPDLVEFASLNGQRQLCNTIIKGAAPGNGVGPTRVDPHHQL